MPTNLHALIRYRTIDKCLRERGKTWTWQELAAACESTLHEEMGVETQLSRRTIMYDLDHMKSGKLGYNAPIVYNRGRRSYEYDNPDYSINQVPMSAHALDELGQALLIIRQFSDQERIDGIGRVIAELEHTLNIQREDQEPKILFEQGLNHPGQKWIDTIYRHIKGKECVTVTYQPFGQEKTSCTVSPYLLKEFNGRWFLFGFNHEVNDIQNLALDRITDVRNSLQPFFKEESFDPETWFREIVGVTRPSDKEPSRVVLEVAKQQAAYFETKPIHPSQKLLKEKKKSKVFTLDLVPNFEFESKVLALGEFVKVLEPASLRASIGERVMAAATFYQQEQKKRHKQEKAERKRLKTERKMKMRDKKKRRKSEKARKKRLARLEEHELYKKGK